MTKYIGLFKYYIDIIISANERSHILHYHVPLVRVRIGSRFTGVDSSFSPEIHENKRPVNWEKNIINFIVIYTMCI